MFRTAANLPASLLGLSIRFLQQPRRMLAACTWFIIAEIGISGASAFSILGDGIISSRIKQRGLGWVIAETSASNQENKKSGNQNNADDDTGTFCVKRMDACYEDCKLGEAQPETCNLSCTTDKICGMPVRLSYGQFLDFQVEMLAANANISPKTSQHPQNANSFGAQSITLPEPKRRPQHNRSPGVRAKPASGRPGGGSAETEAAGSSGWLNLSWPQINWPHF
jgi:hypothetical protein